MVNDKVKITVIIPAYNCEKTIGACIDSVLKQSLRNIQVIVVDDGSKDKTCEIVFHKAKDDDRVEVIKQENTGPSGARNTGIKLAKGKFLSFVDADDTILSDMFQTLLDYQNEYKTDLIISGIRKAIKNSKNVNLNVDKVYYYKDKEDIRAHFINMLSMGINSPVGRLYKKDIIDKYDIRFDEKLDVGEDFQFNIDYIDRCNNILFVPDIFYQYNTFDSTLTNRYRKDLFQKRKKSVLGLEQYLRRNGIDRSIICYLYMKLIYAEAMQEIRHGTRLKIRAGKIKTNLNSDEIVMVKKAYRPKTLSERLLYIFIWMDSPYLIDFISFLFIRIQNKGDFFIHRISV